MLDAIGETASRHAAPAPRTYWIDMFCASQPLLGGHFRDPSRWPKGSAEYHARKEDTDSIFDDAHALEAVGEIFFYCSPLTDSWTAPRHPYLLDGIGEPPEGWVRKGPAAITRAWCLFELTNVLLKKTAPLRVALPRQERYRFRLEILKNFHGIEKVLTSVDARAAQISKVEDREYILPRIAQLAGPSSGSTPSLDAGFVQVNQLVVHALREWILETMIQFARTMCSLQVQSGGEIMGDPMLPLLLNSIGVFQSARGFKSSAEAFLRDADAILQHPPYRQRAIERAIESGKGAGSVTSQILTTRHALYNVCKAQGREAEAGHLLQGILFELDAARAVTLQRLESWFILVYLCAFL